MTYDGLGRETTEDYIPCETVAPSGIASSQPAYSAPTYYTGTGGGWGGFEVVKAYDVPDPNAQAGNYATPSNLKGKLTATYSRGEHTNYDYDARGRMVTQSRQVALPSSETYTGAPGLRYAPHWFIKQFAYDNANRPAAETTGADVGAMEGSTEALLGSADVLTAVTGFFDPRGIPFSVGGSYGSLLATEQRTVAGLVASRTYADLAATTLGVTYDAQLRPAIVSLTRTAPALWTGSSTSTYSAPPPADYTIPTVLEAVQFQSRDAVGDPTTVLDNRMTSEWGASAQPVTSSTYHYNDLYSLTGVTRTYATSNAQGSLFTSSDPPPIGFSAPPTRAASLGYSYDWQGNLTSSTDESNATLQRSIGTGAMGTSANGGGPNQLMSGVATTGAATYSNTYDAAGNLKTLAVTDLPIPASTDTFSVTLTYDWDEAGHLRAAARNESVWTPPTELCIPHSGCTLKPPTEVSGSTIENTYLYDGSGSRVVHSSNNDATAAEAYNVDVFSSLRLTDATFSTDYERDDTTEQVYLCFGGISYGRVVYDADKTLPSATGSWQHVFLEMTDPLGSTSSVVDRDSSELVEQITYLPYGQVDTDYRPTRWNSFREPYQYTGKEGDYEVGLSYFGARYYSPLLHRWASADPLAIHGLGGDLNPYRFVSGNPVRFVDPTGLDGGEPDVGTINDQPAPELGGTITAAPAPAPPPPPDVSQTPPPVNSPVPSDPTLEAGPPTPMLYDGGFVMATPDPPWFQEGSGGATWVDGNGTQRWNPNAHGPRAAQLFGAEGVDLVYQHQQNVELLKHSVQALSAATLLIPGLGEGVLSVELGEGALAAEGLEGAASATGQAMSREPWAWEGMGNITHAGGLEVGDALEAGEAWVGPGYKEVYPGVFRSGDGLRQFRMMTEDITGAHGPLGPHVHFEALDPLGGGIENLHVPLIGAP